MSSLAGIELPDDLFWSDEFTAWRVGQVLRTSLTGALIVQESARQAGRPVTLESTEDAGAHVGCVPLATLNALRALEEQPGSPPMTLVLPDAAGTRSMQVLWRRVDGAAIEARPIVFRAPAIDSDYFAITLRLIQV